MATIITCNPADETAVASAQTQVLTAIKQASSTPLLCITGPTASGKSSFAMDLAKQLSGEIIAADSTTVRRRLDIGSAKPNMEERDAVPHHLLDVADPCSDYTAVDFVTSAREIIADLQGRGTVPLLVGGTKLYINGVLFNYSFMPRGEAKYADMSLETLQRTIGEREMYNNGLDKNNVRQLRRYLATGGQRPSQEPLREDAIVVVFLPSKNWLRERIQLRTEQMFRAGLRHEVEELAQQYGWDCHGLTSIGYQEFKPYFAGRVSMGKVKRQINADTLKLATVQLKWLLKINY